MCVACSVNDLSGGYSCGVPPLPIPNREVKPARADGTAMQCGRVGRRLLLSGCPCSDNGARALFFVIYRLLGSDAVVISLMLGIMSKLIVISLFSGIV